ncbi:helix-turn-helix domain-containing protein [Gemmata sp.]|uniref:helix-turn-helix domain-containing protein n=1 Tax=Gemmata sp. TaxID=1914242 RepID=UPI003F7035AB
MTRGMTQADLAQKADISPTYVSELENADSTPGIDLIDRLARALGVEAAELLPVKGIDPLPALKEQAGDLFGKLLASGDKETFLKMNPLPALLVEERSRRG